MRRDVVAVFDADGSRPDLPRLDPADFSRFKHGAADATWRLGRHLADHTADHLPDGVVGAERLSATGYAVMNRDRTAYETLMAA